MKNLYFKSVSLLNKLGSIFVNVCNSFKITIVNNNFRKNLKHIWQMD